MRTPRHCEVVIEPVVGEPVVSEPVELSNCRTVEINEAIQSFHSVFARYEAIYFFFWIASQARNDGGVTGLLRRLLMASPVSVIANRYDLQSSSVK